MADFVADRASNRTLCVQSSQDGMRFSCDGFMDCRLLFTAIFGCLRFCATVAGRELTVMRRDESFNSITGLNGSGKSNILDAICFVLGITNMSTVRAQNLQDLIYKRGQAGVTKASVTIVFDNRDTAKSPIGFEESDQRPSCSAANSTEPLPERPTEHQQPKLPDHAGPDYEGLEYETRGNLVDD